MVGGLRLVPYVQYGSDDHHRLAGAAVMFPDRCALCMAENATHNLHNLLTLRGALVRDPRIRARYLNEAIVLFGDRADVAFALTVRHRDFWAKWRSNVRRAFAEASGGWATGC